MSPNQWSKWLKAGLSFGLAGCAMGPSEERLNCLTGCALAKDQCMLNAMSAETVQTCDWRARRCTEPCPQ